MSAHHFEAEGRAPFIKLPKGAAAVWKLSTPVEIEASGGFLRAGKSFSTLGKGTFRIIPFVGCEARADYDSPMYLLGYDKLVDTLINRYEFELLLRPQWRADLWPHLFDFYLKTGEWPMSVKSYARLFRRILKHPDVAEDAEGSPPARWERARKKLVAKALTRLGINHSAKSLALLNAEEITRKLVGCEYFSEMLAEMEMLRSIKRRSSIVPLAGAYSGDELGFKTPFEIARPKRIIIRGRCAAEYMWEYGEMYGSPSFCSSIELFPSKPQVLASRLIALAERVRVPLDTGVKKSYGMLSKAPVIVKGQNARVWVADAKPGRVAESRRRLRRLAGRSHSRYSDTDLCVKIFATEA